MLAGIARRVGRRLLASIPALLGVVVVTFILMRVLPGDPATFFASGPSAGQAEIEELRQRTETIKHITEKLKKQGKELNKQIMELDEDSQQAQQNLNKKEDKLL